MTHVKVSRGTFPRCHWSSLDKEKLYQVWLHGHAATKRKDVAHPCGGITEYAALPCVLGSNTGVGTHVFQVVRLRNS